MKCLQGIDSLQLRLQDQFNKATRAKDAAVAPTVDATEVLRLFNEEQARPVKKRKPDIIAASRVQAKKPRAKARRAAEDDMLA